MDNKKRATLKLYLGKSKPSKTDASIGSKGSMFNKFDNAAMDRGSSELPSTKGGTESIEDEAGIPSGDLENLRKRNKKTYKSVIEGM